MLMQSLHGISRRTATLAGVIFGLVTLPAAAATAPTVTSHGELQAPALGLVTSPDGSLWHTSAAGNAAHVGRTTVLGRTNELPLGEQATPGAIVRGPDDALWFADAGGAIQRVTTNVSVETVGEVKDGTPVSLAAGSDGNVWFTVASRQDDSDDDEGPGPIGRLTPGGELTRFGKNLSASPHDIARGWDNALWFTEPSGDRIGRISVTGDLTEFPAAGRPNSIAAGGGGAMWFTARENAIGRIDVNGTVTMFSAGLPKDSRPGDIALGVDGAMWFTRRTGIGRIAPDGAITTFEAPGMRPGSIAYGGDGAMWFTDASNPVLGRIATTTAATPPPPAILPVLGQTITASVDRGQVRVKVPGTDRFVALDALSALPVGTIVDATNGRVSLRSALSAAGDTQTGSFFGGRFKVRQSRSGGGVVKIALSGRLDCRPRASTATTSRKRKRRRRVWGVDSGGLFETLGLNSIGTVRGTRWLTEDRCGGTFTRVTEGTVVVRNRATGKRVVLDAGETYFAKRRP